MKNVRLFKIENVKGVIKINLCGIKISIKTKNYGLYDKYQDLLTSIKYFSKQYNFDSVLVKRIEEHSKNPTDRIVFEQDKEDLQQHFNTIIDAFKLKPATGILREYQLRMLDVIRDVIPKIEAEGINYIAEGGTLLGIMRHGGFIPWDDDIDFDIPREDYDKLYEYVKKNYLFLDTSNCKTYIDFWTMMNEFLEKHSEQIIFTDLKGYLQAYKGKSIANHVTIDFIPVEYIPENVSMKVWQKWLNKYNKLYLGQKLTFKECVDYYQKEIKTNKIFTTKEKCKYLGMGCIPNFGKKKLIPIEDVFPIKRAKFEGMELNIPNNPASYVGRFTKDWEHVPASIDLAHVIKGLNTFVKFFGKTFYIDYDDLLK